MRFKSFLVCAAEPAGSHTVKYAARLAAAGGARITLADVLEKVPDDVIRQLPEGWDVRPLMREQKTTNLERAAAVARRAGVRPRVALLEGDAIAALVSEVKRGHHDLLVVAAPSGDAVNAGRATAARVVRQSPCPALLVHPGRAHRRRPRVLVAIDSGQVMRDRHRIAHGLIEAGLWAAARLKGEMHVLHAWDSYGERQLVSSGVGRGELQAYRQRLRAYAMSQLRAVVAPFGDRIPADRLHLEKGDAREAIPAFAKRSETDLLVIGTAARSGLARLFIGNTAEAVLNDLPCSMLVVRPPARP